MYWEPRCREGTLYFTLNLTMLNKCNTNETLSNNPESLHRTVYQSIKEQSLPFFYHECKTLFSPFLCSKTTVYGLGSTVPRRKRSNTRCTCINPGDQSCTSFCHNRWVRPRAILTRKQNHPSISQRPIWVYTCLQRQVTFGIFSFWLVGRVNIGLWSLETLKHDMTNNSGVVEGQSRPHV